MIKFKDTYYAARQPDGALIPDIGEVANPDSIPVIVLRYDDDGMDTTAIVHSDRDVIEINHKLHGVDDSESAVVLELMQKHKPGDDPDPRIMAQDQMAGEIVREIDYDFINSLKVVNGEEKLSIPDGPVKMMSVIKEEESKIWLP